MPPRRNKRESTDSLPPRIDASPDEIAEAFFAMPADHEWKYVKESSEGYESGYQCVECSREVSYPETLHDDGRCESCHKQEPATC